VRIERKTVLIDGGHLLRILAAAKTSPHLPLARCPKDIRCARGPGEHARRNRWRAACCNRASRTSGCWERALVRVASLARSVGSSRISSTSVV